VAGPGRIILQPKNCSPPIAGINTDPKPFEGCFLADAPQLILAFVSPILRLNEAALDNSFFATQLDHRKN
jgi:hypothetical protein